MLWEEESRHDKAVKTVAAYLRKKYKVKTKLNESVGAKRRPDVSAHDESKRIWYLCEVKDSRSDLEKVLNQLDTNRHFLTRKSTKYKVVCFVGVTKHLFDDIRKDVGVWEELKKRMTKHKIRILVIRKSTVEPA